MYFILSVGEVCLERKGGLAVISDVYTQYLFRFNGKIDVSLMFSFGHVLVVADRSLMLRHLLILFPHLSWVGFETWSPVLGPSDPPP